jgi:hypothetical protein
MSRWKGSLPFAFADHFIDFPLDHIAFEKAQMFEKEDTVEVIHLMTKRAGEKAAPLEKNFLTVQVDTT